MGLFGRQTDVNALIASGRYQKAALLLEQQIAKDPRSIKKRQTLADVLVRSGDVAKAVTILDGLAEEFVKEGFVAKAVAVLKRMQRLDPDRADTSARLGSLMEAQMTQPVAGPPLVRAHVPAEIMAESPESPMPEPATERRAAATTSVVKVPAEWFGRAESRSDFNWSPLLADLSSDELTAIVGGLRLLVKNPGAIVFTEGETGDSLFILASGYARVYQRSAEGRNEQLRVLKEGDFFGAASLLEGAGRTATVTAASECELLELDRETFNDIATLYPGVRERVTRFHRDRSV